uniref:TFIIS N-terminal domain-containing protein n=1 Tax=Setaria italica TaxID=4555 RepID=K3ZDU9_SETIT
MASGGQQTTCTVRSDAAGDVVKRVAKLNANLVSEEGGEAVLQSLRQLQGVRMTFEALEATKVGRAVNALRKSAPSAQARQLAAELYRRWKALADEHFATRRARAAGGAPKVDDGSVASPWRKAMPPPAIVKKQRIIRLVVKNSRPPSGGSNQQSSAASTATVSHQGPASVAKRVSPATSAASLTKAAKPPPPTALPKPSGSGACKRKEAPPAASDEARLARAKVRLHEGYKEASTVKEKRKIQVIAAAPGKRRQP